MKKKERMSNFELLRIISMILIIIHHIFVHAIKIQINSNLYPAETMFNNLIYYRKLMLVDIASTFGKIGVACFILISGYFLFSKKDINIPERAKKVFLQMLFAAICLIFGSIIYNKFIDHSLYSIIGINIISNEWWFIGYYLLILIIGQLLINKKINQKQHILIMVSLLILSSLQFGTNITSDISYYIQVLLSGLFYFLLGGYIKKYNPFNNIKGFIFILLILLSFGLIAITYRNTALSTINYIVNNNIEITSYQNYFYNYFEGSIPVIIISISLFELFRRINIKNSRIINYISSAMFMTYLIHDNDFVRVLFNKIEWVSKYCCDFKIFILYVFIVTLVVLIVGIISYIIYDKLMLLIKSDKVKKICLKNN